MSHSASVPRDSAEGRDFLQRRIALFALVLFLLDFGFYALVRLLELLAGKFDAGIFLVPTELAHLGSCAVLALMWLVCRRGRRSPAALDWIDAGGFILVGVFYALMGATMPLGNDDGLPRAVAGAFASLIMLIAFANTLIGRAVLVPTSPRRTFWIAIGAIAPILAAIVFLRLYRTGFTASDRVLGIVQFTAYAALPIIISTVTARVIYGLRQKVREATQLGQYTLEEKIGEGAMGAVYRARHAMLRRPTAIKLLPPDRAGERGIARFEREVQLTSTLTHPNTVAIYDYGRTPDGVFYYAMELMDGVDLEQLVRGEGPQRPGRVAHVLAQVCGALDEAHGVGLIHRDIKPANILLCQRGGAHDVAKVVDFGLVKDRDGAADGDAALSTADAITGTPLYLSPEAINQPGDIDGRSDLYAVGAVGYFLLTGRPVFTGATFTELCFHHLRTAPVPPAERLGRPLPERLCQVLMQCLAKRREDRPAAAADLQAALLDCGVESWSKADASGWWREHGAAVRARRAAPVEAFAATVAIDLRRRRPDAAAQDGLQVDLGRPAARSEAGDPARQLEVGARGQRA